MDRSSLPPPVDVSFLFPGFLSQDRAGFFLGAWVLKGEVDFLVLYVFFAILKTFSPPLVFLL